MSPSSATVAIPVTGISLSGVPTSVTKGANVPADNAVSLSTANANVKSVALAFDNDTTMGTGKFKGNTTYTGTITVTLNEGNKFAASANDITVTGADGWTKTRTNDTVLTLTKQFPKTDQKAVSALTVTTQPTKTVYTHGDTFDASGMVVKATYDDGTEDAAFTGYTVGYQTSGKNYIVNGNNKVTLTAGTASADVNITSNKKTLDAPTVTATNRDYEAGNTSVALTVGNLTGVVTGEDVTFEKPTTGTISSADAGEGKAVTVSTISLTGSDAGNYTLTQPTGVTVTISKADAPAEWKTASGSAMYGKSGTVDLTGKIAAGGSAGALNISDTNVVDNDAEKTKIAGSTLSFAFKGDNTTIGQKPTITIPVTGATNYKDYSIVVTLEVLAKNAQPMHFETKTEMEVTYGSSATGRTVTGTLGDAAVTYASSDENVVTVNESTGAITKIVGVGTATITATAAEVTDYAKGTDTYTIKVNPKAITVTAGAKSKTFGASDPTLTYTASPSLETGDEFTGALTRDAGENVGTYAIKQGTLSAGKNYTITYTGANLTINAKALADSMLTITGAYTYTGSPITPTYTVKDGETALVADKDYTVAITSNTDASTNTATVTLTGKGNYSGTASKKFDIAAKSIADATISGLPASMEYTGSALEPDVTVTLGGKTLAKGTDYTVAYAGKSSDAHKDVSDSPVTVTVTGTGNYTGTATSKPTFTITAKAYTGTATITIKTDADSDGKVSKGDTLQVTLSPTVSETVTYQWKVDGTDSGTSSNEFTVPDGASSVTVTATITGNRTGEVTAAAVEVGKKSLDGVSISVSGDAGVDKVLTAAVNAGSSGITENDYDIQWCRDGSPISGATGTTYTTTAADQGHSITAKLVAKGDNFSGELVSAGKEIPAGTPTVTANASAGNAQATVTWSATPNGQTITQYKVTNVTNSEVVTVDASTTSHTFTGLTNGTEYTFKVTAVYSSGTADSAEVKATPKAPAAPSNPTNPTPSSTDSTIGGGGGGGYTPRDRDTDSSTTTNKSTTTNADGSTTTTVKNSDGSVTETTRATDGSTTTTKTEKTGEATTTEKAADGSTGTTKTDAAGNTVAASATVSQQAVRNAARYGSAVKVPVSVKASNSAASAAAVDIALPETSEPVAVEIPVENVSAGTVAVIVHPDGTEEIVKTSTVGKDGVVLTLDGSAKVKIVDNSKYFADVPSYEWYSDNVAWASSREIMNGTGDFAFAPNDPTSRSMVAQLLFNLDGAAAPNEITTLFADVDPSDWYANSVTWAVSSGIARGMGDNLFGADQVVTREQFAVMMYNYAKLKGYDVSTSGSLASFPDAGSVSDWAADAMAWAVGVGLINGTTDANGSTVLNAQGTATRAQVAAIMQRFCEKVAK